MEEKNFSAFPAAAVGPDGEFIHQSGMKMRDWFAGLIAQAYISGGEKNLPRQDGLHPGETCGELIARQSYYMADYLMKERAKK